ncbi:MAG: nucleotidyltransferase family protein [Desulfobacterales bacterium]|nr:MAG: nucleotidyltransferase family protein [Desulfobacterales bacterium]
MNDQISLKTSSLKELWYGNHPDFKLCGEPRNALFKLPSNILTYIGSLLSNEIPIAPAATADQWHDFFALLKPHWIAPLLYWRIGSLPQECLPPGEVNRQLRRTFHESRVRSLRLERQLGEILDAFKTEGVRFLVLRGPALGFSVYPDPALRPGSDLDLLVLPKQTRKARKILEDLGYGCLGKRFEVTRDFFREEEYVHKKHPKDNLPVDLHWVHWELHPFFKDCGGGRLEDLFRRASTVEKSDLAFETMHPVDALIHAAIHLALIHRRDIRLVWIYDIALLARGLRIPEDWEVLPDRSVTWRARLAVEHCLKMALVWTGLRLPDGFRNFNSWPRPTADERMTWSHSSRSHWAGVLLRRYLKRPGGVSAMASSLFRLLFPHPQMVRMCYPPSRNWLLPLSYVRRWRRWFVELVMKRIRASGQQV